ncbi:hypothetical protein AGMMS49546_08290 [Spirochaetia bacterium]|nr:hypothetical protein AGMMS49546_08290 [Spirochaetia bacterium]
MMPDLKPELYFGSSRGPLVEKSPGDPAPTATPTPTTTPEPEPAPPPALPPIPTLALSWDTGSEITVQNGDTVTWPAYDPREPVSAQFTANVRARPTNVPEGFGYLQWSFTPSPNLTEQDGNMMFGLWGMSGGSPPLGSPGEMPVVYTNSGTKTATIHVRNCDIAGNPGTLSASFTVNVTETPHIVLSFNCLGNGLPMSSVYNNRTLQDGETIPWVVHHPGAGANPVQGTARAVLMGDLTDHAGFQYLQWSFAARPSVVDNVLASHLLFNQGFPALQAMDSTVGILNKGLQLDIGRTIYVWNCNSAGQPGTLSAEFTLDVKFLP